MMVIFGLLAIAAAGVAYMVLIVHSINALHERDERDNTPD